MTTTNEAPARWRRGDTVEVDGPNKDDGGWQYMGRRGSIVEFKGSDVVLDFGGNKAKRRFDRRNVRWIARGEGDG